MPTMLSEVTRSTHTAVELAHSLKSAWRNGSPPDTVAALKLHPELLRYRSLVVELAYEEYCLREEAGAPPARDDFCNALPAFRSQIREVIRGHELIANHPELFGRPEPHWPTLGGEFEGLMVLQELGRGSFARVYLALDPATGDRPVALKISTNPSSEARTLGPILHPNIGSVLWARCAQGLYTVCMPFVGAATLLDAISSVFRRGRNHQSTASLLDAIETAALDRPEVAIAPVPKLVEDRDSYTTAIVRIASRVADGLAELHHRGIAHGDLKPSNILLRSGGEPLLIDFNLSTDSSCSLMHCGGTLPYMAPERIRLMLGERLHNTDPRQADIYSFGIVLFEALTGRIPFAPSDQRNLTAVAQDLLLRQQVGLPEFGPDIPRSLASILASCLRQDPRERPTAQELQSALAWIGRRSKRRQVNLTMLAFAVALSAFGAAIFSQYAEPPQRVELSQLTAMDAPVTEGSDPGSGRPVPDPELEPITASDFFDRGVKRLEIGQIEEARRDFTWSLAKEKSGKTTAYLAYCYHLSEKYQITEPLYRQAVEKYQFDQAWVRNNWAHCLLASGNPTLDQLRTAIQQTTLALETEPNLRAARYNRAYACFLLSLRIQSPSASNVAIVTPPEFATAISDIEFVIASGPCDVELFSHAAVIIAHFGTTDAATGEKVVHYCREAIRRGKSEQQLRQDPLLRAILNDVHLTSPNEPPAEQPSRGKPLNARLASPPAK